MAQEHLLSLMTSVGLEQTDIDAVLALPADTQDFKPESYTGKIHTSIETKVKNDPSFWEGLDENNVNETLKKKIEAQQYGRAANIVRQKTLKALGLKEEDLADIPEEERKNLETFISKAGEKYASSKAGDKELQKQLQETRKKLEDLEADIPVKETKLKQEYETAFNNEKLDFIILAELATIENLKAPAQYLASKITSELKSENNFVISGMKAHPKQKANPALDILDGSKVVGLKDLIIKKLKADNLIEEKPAPPPRNGKVEIEPDGKGGLEISSHILNKINANIPAS